MNNVIEFRLWGRRAMFCDPVSKIGGEKTSYPIPTYQALKGIVESIYWKPTIIWIIERLRVINPILNESVNMLALHYNRSNSPYDRTVHTYLHNVEYQVRARFIWNPHRPDLAGDCNERKHSDIAHRALSKGGYRDIFLGTRECQGYVEPCTFGEGPGAYDGSDRTFDIMFHGFDYADETGDDSLRARFWYPEMRDGIVDFIRPDQCPLSKHIKNYTPRRVGIRCGAE